MKVFKLPMVVTDEALDTLHSLQERLREARASGNKQEELKVLSEKKSFISSFQSGYSPQ